MAAIFNGNLKPLVLASPSMDTSGLLRQVVVTAADVDDREGLKQVLTRLKAAGVARLRKLWVDGGYQGEAIRTWVANQKKTHKIDLEVVATGFVPVQVRLINEKGTDVAGFKIGFMIG